MQIFIDFHQGIRGPYGKGLVGHYASGHFLNPPLLLLLLLLLLLFIAQSTHASDDVTDG